jgi:Tfp pilus assembly protein FimT
MELGVCLVVMAIAAAVVTPAISRLGNGKPETGGEQLVALLTQARELAIRQQYTVTVHIDPVTNRFRVDTASLRGTGVYADSTLDLPDSETMETELDRLRFTFKPTGAALGDSVMLRGSDASYMLSIDPWTGEAKRAAR